MKKIKIHTDTKRKKKICKLITRKKERKKLKQIIAIGKGFHGKLNKKNMFYLYVFYALPRFVVSSSGKCTASSHPFKFKNKTKNTSVCFLIKSRNIASKKKKTKFLKGTVKCIV